MRGTRFRGDRVRGNHGIIPAYAGNTCQSPCQNTSGRDHPRVCGEHPPGSRRPTAAAGSSPRMRGTLQRRHPGRRQNGIIPAYAGNTGSLFTSFLWFRDHPRVCGEHAVNNEHADTIEGSSPRMRGTLWRCMSWCLFPGIIPAYAGNTSSNRKASRATGDHPRVCGEHHVSPPSTVLFSGSSPRMRGTHQRDEPVCVCCGIIPAYAGNTYSSSGHVPGVGDHPRVCGEHSPACRS